MSLQPANGGGTDKSGEGGSGGIGGFGLDGEGLLRAAALNAAQSSGGTSTGSPEGALFGKKAASTDASEVRSSSASRNREAEEKCSSYVGHVSLISYCISCIAYMAYAIAYKLLYELHRLAYKQLEERVKSLSCFCTPITLLTVLAHSSVVRPRAGLSSSDVTTWWQRLMMEGGIALRIL